MRSRISEIYGSNQGEKSASVAVEHGLGPVKSGLATGAHP